MIKEIISITNEQADFYVTKEIMKKISSQVSIANNIAVCYKIKEQELKGNIVLLDNIQDPGNLGTIIRSAVAFGFKNIILSDDTVDLYNDKVIRASEGMIFHINVLRKNLELFLEELKQNYQILITDVMQGENIKKIKHTKNIALIIGNEGNGVKDNLKKYANNFVKINMDETCESLNASIAASILMYEIMESKNE